MTIFSDLQEVELDNQNQQKLTESSEKQQTVIFRRYSDKVYSMQIPMTESMSEQAIHIFLSNTVVLLSTNAISKGYFAELFALFQSSSSQDALPWALEAVALASFANRFRVQKAQFLAMERYSHAVKTLRNISLSSSTNMSSLISCILLLGVYEVINASSINDSMWLQHLHGLIAVMKNLIQTNRIPAIGIPTLVLGSDSPVSLSNQYDLDSQRTADMTKLNRSRPAILEFHSLCSILPKAQSLFKKSKMRFNAHSISYGSDLSDIRREALALKSELLTWSTSQSNLSRQTTIHYFTHSYTIKFPGAQDLVCPATRADMYHDYFAACMWISYRQCLLHLTDLFDRVSRSLSADPVAYTNSREHKKNLDEIQTLVHDICASIPFMLAGTNISGTIPSGSIWMQSQPPMLVGGLNLQWILFTISILESVHTDVKADMKRLLVWIGANLGIGQATVLAQMNKNAPDGLTAKGDALRWVGFLT